MNSFIFEILKTANLENLLYFFVGVLLGLSVRPIFLFLTKTQKLKKVCVKNMKLENNITKTLYPNLGYKLVTKKHLLKWFLKEINLNTLFVLITAIKYVF